MIVENLGKLQKADIDFDELTAMASEQSSSGPALHEMTPATISSGLVPNHTPSTPPVPPSRTNWDILFQLMFDELLTPLPSVDLPALKDIALVIEVEAPVPAVSTSSPSSTTVDQDAPSPSNSQTTPETQPLVIPNDVEENNHDIKVAHMGNDPYFGVLISEVLSDQSSSSDSIHTILHEQALFCYYDDVLTAVKPKTYKDALTQSCWIKAMQEELNDFTNALKYGSRNSTNKDYGDYYFECGSTKLKLDELGGILKEQGSIILEAIRFSSVFLAHIEHGRQQMDVKLHFLNGNLREEEHVEKRSYRTYFVNSGVINSGRSYQLADIFTKPLCRERIEFLINKLGMRSVTPGTLKQLADEVAK
ncbi:hypothetical protein Tco_0509747 [Tanacetum coccineum]